MKYNNNCLAQHTTNWLENFLSDDKGIVAYTNRFKFDISFPKPGMIHHQSDAQAGTFLWANMGKRSNPNMEIWKVFIEYLWFPEIKIDYKYQFYTNKENEFNFTSGAFRLLEVVKGVEVFNKLNDYTLDKNDFY